MGDFNTPNIPMDRSFRQNINKKKQTLSETLDQIKLVNI